MRDQQAVAGTVQVFELDMGAFRQAQAAPVDAAQESASAQVALGADGQEPFDFGHAVDPRGAGWAAGPFDPMEQRLDVLLEEFAVEGAHRVDGQVNRGRSLLALGN
jgi:hypothetical protein